jgi:hypothetical protein
MKRLLALLAGGLGLRAILRRRARRAPLAASPAQELRAKLAETKEPEAESGPATAPEPPAEPVAEPEPEAEPETVDSRRADVHARARQAVRDLGEPEP